MEIAFRGRATPFRLLHATIEYQLSFLSRTLLAMYQMYSMYHPYPSPSMFVLFFLIYFIYFPFLGLAGLAAHSPWFSSFSHLRVGTLPGNHGWVLEGFKVTPSPFHPVYLIFRFINTTLAHGRPLPLTPTSAYGGVWS